VAVPVQPKPLLQPPTSVDVRGGSKQWKPRKVKAEDP
jgi:hypothetical protein